MSRVWLSSPHMGGTEERYVAEAFSTNWVAPLGPNVDEFERQLAAFTGVRSAAALSSGTAALHLSLVLAGVTKGDIVLCQSFTFAASAFPILYNGAIPVFVDSESDTWNMDPSLLRKAVKEYADKGQKPKAIIAVHLYGMPAKMYEIKEIAAEYEITLIEDAAEALGSTYHGKACGSLGDMGILSFNGNKIITTSGGGALVSDNEEQIKKARFLSTQSKEPAPYYLHLETGYNYRMSNICAGIGRGQMEVIDDRVKQRRAHHEAYESALGKINGIRFLKEPQGFFSNRWLTTVCFDRDTFGEGFNEKLRVELEKYNIESRPLWKPLHQQPVFENCHAFQNGIADELFATGLCLPSGSNMNETTRTSVIEKIKAFIA